MGLFDQYLGRHISDTVGDFLGDDRGAIVDIVQTTLSGSQEESISLVSAQEEEDQQAAIPAGTGSGLASDPDKVPPE
jgi:hypothetical protein